MPWGDLIKKAHISPENLLQNNFVKAIYNVIFFSWRTALIIMLQGNLSHLYSPKNEFYLKKLRLNPLILLIIIIINI